MEFRGKKNEEIYREYNIKHVRTHGIIQKVAPIEKKILEIKQKLYKIMAANNTKQWLPYIEDVRKSINATFNVHLGMSPDEAMLEKNQNQVFKKSVSDREDKLLAKSMGKPFKYNLNDIVCVSQQHSSFQKMSQGSYSQALYRITDRFFKGGVHVYTLSCFITGELISGVWFEQELTQVKGAKIKQNIDKIHSFRLDDNNNQMVLVSFTDNNRKKLDLLQ